MIQTINSEQTITPPIVNIDFDGAIDVGETIRDFDLSDIGSIPNLKKQDDIIFEYNQFKKAKWGSDCTLFGPFGALSDLFNKRFTDDDIESIRKLASERGKKDNKGRYSQLGVKTVCDWWNNNNNNKVLYFKGDLMGNDIKEALGYGYSVVVTLKGNNSYNQDIYKDGIVDGIDFGKHTFGHCTRIKLINGKICVIDSASGVVSYNIYQLKDLAGLVKNYVFYPTAYVILEQAKVEKDPNELKRLAEFKGRIEQNIENNSIMRHLSNDTKYKDWLHQTNNKYREKLEDIKIEENNG